MTRLVPFWGKPARSVPLVGALAIGAVVVTGACRKNPQLAFQVDVPSDVAGTTAWVEVAAYPGGSCPALLAQAAGGLPQGYTARIAFRPDQPERPAMGDLPKKSYAFVGTARDASCGVIAIGCASTDVSNASNVDVALQDTGSALGTCSADAVCQDAVCVTSPDSTNPSLGTGCSLQLIGAGPLGSRILDGDSFADETIGSPGVVATANGFLIAYREVAGNLSPPNARITTMTIDPGGGTPGPASANIPRCLDDNESDGIGLALAGDVGLLGASRHICTGATAGVDYLSLNGSGNVGGYSAVYNANQPTSTVEFSQGRTIAVAPGKGVFDVTYLQGGQAIFAQATSPTLATKPTESPTRIQLLPGAAPLLEAHVATSDKLVAFLTRSAGGSSSSGDVEGGSPGDSDGGGTDTSSNTLHLQIAPATSSPTSFATPLAPPPATDIPGDWGAVAASSDNVFVLTTGTDVPLHYYVYSADRKPVADTGIALLSPDPVLYGDIALVGNRALIAASRTGAISLLAMTSAADAGTILPEIVLGDDPRVPDLRPYRDGHVVVAASATRVIVVWTTATSLKGSDPTGGYALFACAN